MTTVRPKCVVIADDDVQITQALGRIVRSMGHTTLVAEDGVEALQLLRENRVDLLLSDIDMPRMDGVTLVARARAEMLAPVRILLTANARLEVVIRAINTGEIHRFLQKPWDHDELLRAIEEAFARIDDLSRMGAAGQAAERLLAACKELEVEYPGVTQIARSEGHYVLNEAAATHSLATWEGASVLQTLVLAGSHK